MAAEEKLELKTIQFRPAMDGHIFKGYGDVVGQLFPRDAASRRGVQIRIDSGETRQREMMFGIATRSPVTRSKGDVAIAANKKRGIQDTLKRNGDTSRERDLHKRVIREMQCRSTLGICGESRQGITCDVVAV